LYRVALLSTALESCFTCWHVQIDSEKFKVYSLFGRVPEGISGVVARRCETRYKRMLADVDADHNENELRNNDFHDDVRLGHLLLRDAVAGFFDQTFLTVVAMFVSAGRSSH
jgi:hypothetical protein